MKKIVTVLIVVMLMMVSMSGCAGQRQGIDEIRVLTGEEKSELVRIALGMDEVGELLDNKEDYHISIGWALITWDEDDDNELEIGYFPYDDADSAERFVKEIAGGAEIYAAVMIQMGDPIDYGVNVAINPDTLQVVSIIRHPITPVQ